MSEQDWIAAGLLDPSEPDAGERREILAYLASLGIGVDAMREAERTRSLVTAATDQLLQRRGTFDLAGAARRAGVPVDLARRVYLAMGLAVPADDVVAFDGEDVALLERFTAAMAFLGEEPILTFLRVVGSSLARIAEAADAMFLAEVEGPLRAGGGRSVDVARSAREGLELLLGLPVVLAPMFHHHVASAVERSRSARGGGRVDRFRMAVGFADLVGSTRLTATTAPDVLGRALAGFEREAADRSTAAGVRLVKAIGDEVMIAGSSVDAVVAVLVALAAFVDAHPVLTATRGAVAVGELQGRGGDWFGPEVNVAARAVKEAVPGTVVVTAEVAAELDGGRWRTAPLGARPLRGIDGPVPLFVVGEGGAVT